jgi:hypothetical protein
MYSIEINFIYKIKKMKFNRILKFVLIFSIFLISQISSRTTRSFKSLIHSKKALHKATYQNKGSYESGYTCKRLRVWKGVKERGTDSVVADIKFIPRQIDSPKDEIEQSGIIFEFEPSKQPYGWMERIFEPHPIKPNHYILPYKNMYQDFYQERVGMWKILGMGGGRHTVLYSVIRHKLNPEKLYLFKLSLPYEGNNVLMPEDEIGRVLFRIQENRKTVLKSFETLKKNAIVASTSLIRDKEVESKLEVYKSSEELFKKSCEDKLQVLTMRLTKKKIGQLIFDHQAAEYRDKRREKHNELTHLVAQRDAEVKELEEIEKQLEEFKKKEEISKTDMAVIQRKKQASFEKIQAQLQKIMAFDPRDLGSELEPVLPTLQSGKMSLEQFLAEIKKIIV